MVIPGTQYLAVCFYKALVAEFRRARSRKSSKLAKQLESALMKLGLFFQRKARITKTGFERLPLPQKSSSGKFVPTVFRNDLGLRWELLFQEAGESEFFCSLQGGDECIE